MRQSIVCVSYNFDMHIVVVAVVGVVEETERNRREERKSRRTGERGRERQERTSGGERRLVGVHATVEKWLLVLPCCCCRRL